MPLELSRKLVLKKLRNVFPEGRTAAEALTTLDFYVGDCPKGQARVQLAILKQCGCDLKRLDQLVKLACADFRDVLVGAEYPQEFMVSTLTPPDEMAVIRQRDRTQYEVWLDSEES